MNTRCREWSGIGLALVLAAGIYACSHRHLSLQVALDREAVLALYDEIIDLHWQQLTEIERVADGVTWDSLKRQVSFRNIRAKQTGTEIRVRVHIYTSFEFPRRPKQVQYYAMSLNVHGNWTIGPLGAAGRYWFM